MPGAAGAVSTQICTLSNKQDYTGRPNSLRAEAIRATALRTSQFCIEVEAVVEVEVIYIHTHTHTYIYIIRAKYTTNRINDIFI